MSRKYSHPEFFNCNCMLCRTSPLSLDMSGFGSLPTPSPATIATMFEEAASIPPAAWVALATVAIPNRLFGVKINHEGDAI